MRSDENDAGMRVYSTKPVDHERDGRMSEVSRGDAMDYVRNTWSGDARDLQKFSTDVAATLQSPIRGEQGAVDDRRNSENTSNDSTRPEWWDREQSHQINIDTTHEVRKCAKDCLVSECTTKMGEMS